MCPRCTALPECIVPRRRCCTPGVLSVTPCCAPFPVLQGIAKAEFLGLSGATWRGLDILMAQVRPALLVLVLQGKPFAVAKNPHIVGPARALALRPPPA